MNGPLRRLGYVVVASFAVLVLAVSYVQVLAADRFRDDPRNERVAIARTGKERGVIVAADGVVLAESVAAAEEQQVFDRLYPGGPPFAHLVGYTSRLFGDTGLESSYADLLRSRRDLTISDLLTALTGGDLRPHRLELTLSSDLQQAVYQALGGQQGAVVALEPRTGAVLALVSSPSFDPAALTGANAAASWEALLADPAAPLSNRATNELYAPASTFKLVVAAAGLDGSIASPDTEYPDEAELDLPGSSVVIRNFSGEPCEDGQTVSLQVAMVQSCNTVFAALAMQLGADVLGTAAEAAGFNRQYELGVPVATSVFPLDELRNDQAALGQSGIGERSVRATTIQMALVAAAIANQGVAMAPFVVRSVVDADGVVVESTEARPLDRAMSPATALLIGQMMERVVTEGTGRRGAIPGVRVAGKTGTTESESRAPDVWFVAFAPVEDPVIALAVFVEEGGEAGESATGGTVAAPIAAEIIAHYLDN